MNFLIALAFLLFSAPSFAQMGGGASIDPFVAAPIMSVNHNTKGTTVSTSQTVNPGIKNLVLIVTGQSNAAAVGGDAYTPSNPTKIDNLHFDDGALYAAKDPLLGTSYPGGVGATTGPGSVALRLADSMVTAGLFDRVILVSIAIGATSVADWDATGFLGTRIQIALRRIAALGIVAGTNVTFAAIWGHGETDNQNGTSQAAYTTGLNNVISASRTAGFNGPWFIASQSYIGTTSSAVTAAQAAVVNHGAGVWAGPNADALTGTACGGSACRQADLQHFSDAGMVSYAAAWKTAMALYGAPF